MVMLRTETTIRATRESPLCIPSMGQLMVLKVQAAAAGKCAASARVAQISRIGNARMMILSNFKLTHYRLPGTLALVALRLHDKRLNKNPC